MSDASDNHQAFAARLRECIAEIGSIAKMSQAVGVHRNTIRLYLEKAEPPRQMVIKLALAAKKSPEWLLTGFTPADSAGGESASRTKDTPRWVSETLAGFTERLASAVERIGGRMVAQQVTGFSASRWDEILAGQMMTTAELLTVCQAFDISADWLMQTKAQVLADFVGIDELVPELDGQTLSVQTFLPRTVAFKRAWLLEHLRCQPSDLLHVLAPDSDMEPLIRRGASLLVNRLDAVTTDGIYVFKSGAQFLVRKLQFIGGDTARVTALADTYAPWSLKNPRMNSEVVLYGKVVWWSRQA